jgi:uncharacterized membrane protein
VGSNLVIAGFTLARFAGPPPRGGGGGGDIDRIVALGIRSFPPEIRRTILDGVRQQRDQIRGRIDAMQDARMHMFEVMRDDTFDRQALDAAFDDVRAKTDDIQKLGQDIVAAAVADAPADVRRKIKPPRGPFP